jgi:hypothetical protein
LLLSAAALLDGVGRVNASRFTRAVGYDHLSARREPANLRVRVVDGYDLDRDFTRPKRKRLLDDVPAVAHRERSSRHANRCVAPAHLEHDLSACTERPIWRVPVPRDGRGPHQAVGAYAGVIDSNTAPFEPRGYTSDASGDALLARADWRDLRGKVRREQWRVRLLDLDPQLGSSRIREHEQRGSSAALGRNRVVAGLTMPLENHPAFGCVQLLGLARAFELRERLTGIDAVTLAREDPKELTVVGRVHVAHSRTRDDDCARYDPFADWSRIDPSRRRPAVHRECGTREDHAANGCNCK